MATCLRAPKKPLILPRTLSDTTGPAYEHGPIGELDNDLTHQHAGEPLVDRVIVTGRVLDGHLIRSSLIELWQANAAWRYNHHLDCHSTPLDPNFSGAGRCLTDNESPYRFVTVKPRLTRGRTTTMPGDRRTFTSRCSVHLSGAGS